MDKSRETAMEYVKKFQELIDNFDSVTCAACDCMGRINGMNSNIRPESRPVRMAGCALTAKTVGGDISAVIYAIENAQKGDIIVVDSHRYINSAYWGENLCLSAINKGVSAAVMDGACRDIEEIRKLGFPIYSIGTCCNVGQISGYGSIKGPITCGGVQVNTYDFILIDGNGIAVVPYENLETVYEKTKKMMDTETNVSDKLKAGETIGHLIDIEKLMKSTFNYQERALEE
ncbi:MAG: RraA family protein [Clostridia bacterium]|nr:RraA family protein [Clostridia bacterium]